MAHDMRGSGTVASGALRLYYDIQGNGPPLLLLHGGMGTIALFDAMRPALNRRWTTIGIEQQGHGHTADIDRALRFGQMADDSAAVIRHLGLDRPHAFGYSDGGNVALGMAIRHADLVGRIAVCGTNANNDGLEPRMRQLLEDGARQDPAEVAASIPAVLRKAYEAVAPHPGHWPMLVHRVFEQAASFEGWTEAQLRAIRSPVLAMVGDRDVVTVDHAAWLSRNCAQGQLCVLPRTDHLAPVARADWVAAIVSDYLAEDLDAPTPMAAAHG